MSNERQAIAALIVATRSALWAHTVDEADRDRLIEEAKRKLYEAEDAIAANEAAQ